MPPAKGRNGGHDESKPEPGQAASSTGNGKDGKDGTHNHGSKEKSGTAAASPHYGGSNGKMRRVASSAGSHLRESLTSSTLAVPHAASPSTNAVGGQHPASGGASSAAAAAASALNAASQDPSAIGLDWPTVDRSVLHSYRRLHRRELNTSTAFESDYHQWILSRPGSIGLQSPTMLRREAFRRQGRDTLAATVRKHHNSQAVQENDVIVDFVHKVRTVDGGDVAGSSGGPGASAVGAGPTPTAEAGPVPKPARSRKKPEPQAPDAQK